MPERPVGPRRNGSHGAASVPARGSLLHRHFIDYHVEELEDSETVVRLVRDAAGGAVGADSFAAAMRLSSVDLWVSGLSDGPPVLLDYVFDPDLSDQILAVKLTRDRTVVSVDWES
ncbi:DUF2004 domain-containing protein [Streptomyces sp. NPDC015032]|uniref:DUF2004 domain-containing protein n=1 Tax=Streptomyces sp. NPDC015032 TaxID=3364937 RepID=UPI0036FAA946